VLKVGLDQGYVAAIKEFNNVFYTVFLVYNSELCPISTTFW